MNIEKIKELKAREKVIIDELEFSPLKSLENELYEIRDTIKKLEQADEPLIYNQYDAFDNKWTKSIIKYE
jgi:hypothetical protein